MPKDLAQKVSPGEVLLRFYDPIEIQAGFRETGWDPQERNRILVEIAKAQETVMKLDNKGEVIEIQRATPRDQMAAIHLLDESIEQSLALSGSLRKVTAVTQKALPGGITATITEQGTRVEYPDRDRMLSTLELLEQADSQELLDLEESDTNGHNGSTNGSKSASRDGGGSPSGDGVRPGPGQPGTGDGPVTNDGTGRSSNPALSPGETSGDDNPGRVATEPGPGGGPPESARPGTPKGH